MLLKLQELESKLKDRISKMWSRVIGDKNAQPERKIGMNAGMGKIPFVTSIDVC